jgi:hypothetical protein
LFYNQVEIPTVTDFNFVTFFKNGIVVNKEKSIEKGTKK